MNLCLRLAYQLVAFFSFFHLRKQKLKLYRSEKMVFPQSSDYVTCQQIHTKKACLYRKGQFYKCPNEFCHIGFCKSVITIKIS